MPPSIPPAAPGLSQQQLRELTEARLRAAKIRRGVAVAYFDFWGVAIFAGLTLLGSLLSFSWPGLLVGIGMAIVAWVELHGARDLRKLDPTAAKRLALNQVFLGAVLLAYAAYTLITGLKNPGAYSGIVAGQIPPELADSSMVGSINDLTRLILIVMYGTLALVAITVQGGTALFYRSRAKHVSQYLADTPPWILQAQQAGVPL